MSSQPEIDLTAIHELASGPEMDAVLLENAAPVVALAEALAPKRTGAGAKSIHAEVDNNIDGTSRVRISWTPEHFYMYFHEVGTSHQKPTPFLRAALYAQSEI